MIFRTKFDISDEVYILAWQDSIVVRCETCDKPTKSIRTYRVLKGVIDTIEIRSGHYRSSHKNNRRDKAHLRIKYGVFCKNGPKTCVDDKTWRVNDDEVFWTRAEAIKASKERSETFELGE